MAASKHSAPPMHAFVIMSGLPASGKSTLAQALASHLNLPHLDKDVFLESLFTPEQTPGLPQRSTLSREADSLFEAAARSMQSAILTSWWRHPRAASQSGTPTDWLQDPHIRFVEVYCECPVPLAIERFRARRRHPGHADALRNLTELQQQFEEATAYGILFPEHALTCSTVSPLSAYEIRVLAEHLQQQIADLCAQDKDSHFS